MNKAIDPKQLDLVKDSREQMILAAAPHIDPDSPALAAATAVLENEPAFDNFDWFTDASVVLQDQRATAIYRNRSNGIVIRQERTWDEESDPFMVITDENLVTFMEALAARARE